MNQMIHFFTNFCLLSRLKTAIFCLSEGEEATDTLRSTVITLLQSLISFYRDPVRLPIVFQLLNHHIRVLFWSTSEFDKINLIIPADAKQILTSTPSVEVTTGPALGQSQMSWMKTMQNDLDSHRLS